jgi:hypothetical protein
VLDRFLEGGGSSDDMCLRLGPARSAPRRIAYDHFVKLDYYDLKNNTRKLRATKMVNHDDLAPLRCHGKVHNLEIGLCSDQEERLNRVTAERDCQEP